MTAAHALRRSLATAAKSRSLLPPGKLAAYDEALKIIAEDSALHRARADELRKRLDSTSDPDARLLRELEREEALSELHDPEVRLRFRQGQGAPASIGWTEIDSRLLARRVPEAT